MFYVFFAFVVLMPLAFVAGLTLLVTGRYGPHRKTRFREGPVLSRENLLAACTGALIGSAIALDEACKTYGQTRLYAAGFALAGFVLLNLAYAFARRRDAARG